MMDSDCYHSGIFTRPHSRYPDVWYTLNDPGVVERMKLLCRRGFPAVCALDIDAEPIWIVLEHARSRGEEDQVKQMIGHQIKQILESKGYRRAGGKPIRTSWIFSFGSVYEDPDWRILYVCRNRDERDQNVFCLSSKRRVSTLPNPPPNVSSWVLYRMCRTPRELNYVLNADLGCDYGWSWDRLCAAVDENGYVALQQSTS
jgi:hypothetical protein